MSKRIVFEYLCSSTPAYLETFYKTIINLPHLIQQQKKEKFITKKYSLVISSKDRDFSFGLYSNEFPLYTS